MMTTVLPRAARQQADQGAPAALGLCNVTWDVPKATERS